MAEVSMQHLTADEHWNQFLQVAQSGLEEDERAIAALTAQLAAPETADANQIGALKLRIAYLRGRIEARSALIALPSEIVGAAKQAKSLLSELG